MEIDIIGLRFLEGFWSSIILHVALEKRHDAPIATVSWIGVVTAVGHVDLSDYAKGIKGN